jgi:hypothetical protein
MPARLLFMPGSLVPFTIIPGCIIAVLVYQPLTLVANLNHNFDYKIFPRSTFILLTMVWMNEIALQFLMFLGFITLIGLLF